MASDISDAEISRIIKTVTESISIELKEIFAEGYTFNDMIRYNNLAYEYLKSSKEVELVEKVH